MAHKTNTHTHTHTQQIALVAKGRGPGPRMLSTKIADFPALFEEIIINCNLMTKSFPVSSQIDVIMIASHINRIDVTNNNSNHRINGLQAIEQPSQSLQGLQSLQSINSFNQSKQALYKPDQRKPENVFLPMSEQPHLVCIWEKIKITDWNEQCLKIYNEFISRFGIGEGESLEEQIKAQTQGYDNNNSNYNNNNCNLVDNNVGLQENQHKTNDNNTTNPPKWRYLIVIESIGYENEFNVYIGKKKQYIDKNAFPENYDGTDLAQILETCTFIFYEKYQPANKIKRMYGGFAQVRYNLCVFLACMRVSIIVWRVFAFFFFFFFGVLAFSQKCPGKHKTKQIQATHTKKKVPR